MDSIRSGKVLGVLNLIIEDRKLSAPDLARYIQGMYGLDKAGDIEDTRTRLLQRWKKGINREILREYKVLYYALGLLLSRVGEK